MLADGNADFAKAVGLTMDGSKFGMGTRSQRYAMLVHDGVVEQLFVEALVSSRSARPNIYSARSDPPNRAVDRIAGGTATTGGAFLQLSTG